MIRLRYRKDRFLNQTKLKNVVFCSGGIPALSDHPDFFCNGFIFIR